MSGTSLASIGLTGGTTGRFTPPDPSPSSSTGCASGRRTRPRPRRGGASAASAGRELPRARPASPRGPHLDRLTGRCHRSMIAAPAGARPDSAPPARKPAVTGDEAGRLYPSPPDHPFVDLGHHLPRPRVLQFGMNEHGSEKALYQLFVSM